LFGRNKRIANQQGKTIRESSIRQPAVYLHQNATRIKNALTTSSHRNIVETNSAGGCGLDRSGNLRVIGSHTLLHAD
jgi:hypothetical protein